MKLCLTLVFIFGVGLGEGKSGFSKTNPILGHRQHETKTLLDEIADGKWKIYDTNTYNTAFRPPGGNDVHPNPTVVKISLTDLFVKSLNDTKGHEFATLKGKFVVEWTDSRLEFESPPGYEKDFVDAREGADSYNNIQMWDPKIISVMEDEFSASAWNNNGLSDAIFLTNKGQVYNQYMVAIETKSPPVVEADGKTITFKVQLTEKKFGVEDLIIEWNKDVAVKVMGNQKTVKIQDEAKKYKFTPSVGKCKRVESYGRFGEMEYPCAELKLKFELVKTS